jgi:hypothetical protein
MTPNPSPILVPAICCRNILFTSNHFAGLHPGGSWLQIHPGCQGAGETERSRDGEIERRRDGETERQRD